MPGFLAGHFSFQIEEGRNLDDCGLCWCEEGYVLLRQHGKLVDAARACFRRVDGVFAGKELPHGTLPQDAALVVELYDACADGPGGAHVELAVAIGERALAWLADCPDSGCLAFAR